jgi:subtilisin family serine protease
MKALDEAERNAAIARARELGLPLRRELPDGRVEEVARLDENGQLLYRTTQNVNAAISTAANLVQAAPYNLTGTNVIVGVWDGGAVRPTHQEFGGRVTVKDGAANDDHATHVGGTIIASGVTAAAKGMATSARIDSYDWNSDLTELTSAGAATAAQTNRVLVSNHSYGYISGWNYVNGGSPVRVWEWWGNGTGTTGFDQDFGRYNADARDTDATVIAVPFTAVFWAAGNERNNNPSAGQSVALSPGSATVVSYSSSSHPPGDGVYRNGYEVIGFNAVAKNIITVGAVNDAVTGGLRDTSNATQSTFSSWGSADDGRIKPDLVANGVSVYSSLAGSDSSYASYNGTSMASPNAAGSAALVVQEYIRLFGTAARASTIKGLLIHTADDLGTAGPDYQNGWGLMNTKAAVDLVRDDAANPNRARLTENLITTSSNSITNSFVWDGVSPIRATLCWTDPAGAATSTSDSRTARLVNNLDLRVVGPNGVTNLPYVMPFVGTWTTNAMSQAATTGTNNVDNVEQVYIASPPAAGTYRAVVTYRGTLSGGQQHFSLLVSGGGEVPPVATGLSATALSSTSIRVSWSAVGNATSYKVQRDGVQIATVSSATTSFTDTGLSASTDYVYRVVASNTAGDAAASDPLTARTLDWIDDNPRRLVLLTPATAIGATNSTFVFTGQAGSGLTNGITWSNALSGQTGFFARVRDWSHEIPLATGTNVVTFRSHYSAYQTNLTGFDFPGASVYSGGWSSGLNGGTGFGPWSLGAAGSAGHFIASAFNNSNLSQMHGFGLWANSGGVATAARSFNVPLQTTGSRFSVFVENNWITENGASSVGFALTDAESNRRFAFSFTGGQANYRIHDAASNRDTGIAWTDTGFTVDFQLTGTDSYVVTVGSNSISGTLAGGGTISRLVMSNNNAGAGEGYNFYVGEMLVQTVADLSGVAEVTAPAVVLADMSPKTDGIPNTWWQLYGIESPDRVAAMDFDRDEISNAMEYFMGLDPTLDDATGAIRQHIAGDSVLFEYRRSKDIDGITGTVKWSTAPGTGAGWSSDSVSDVFLLDEGSYERRRATVPWSFNQGDLFLRIDLTIE